MKLIVIRSLQQKSLFFIKIYFYFSPNESWSNDFQVIVIPEELSFDVSELKEELLKHEMIVKK